MDRFLTSNIGVRFRCRFAGYITEPLSPSGVVSLTPLLEFKLLGKSCLFMFSVIVDGISTEECLLCPDVLPSVISNGRLDHGITKQRAFQQSGRCKYHMAAMKELNILITGVICLARRWQNARRFSSF